MTERGMIFNEYQVRALLDGSITQVRRPVKFPHIDKDAMCELSGNELAGELSAGNYRNSPHGKPGDRLWVRETFSAVPDHDEPVGCSALLYAADCGTPYGKWKPSIHMPRWASRILLEITDVRVERLQAADESALLDNLGDMLEDCDSVAGRAFNHAEHYAIAGVQVGLNPEMHGFKAWWDKANGAGSFDSNPWVWVIEFKRIEGNSHATN
ncbi:MULTISPECIES: hypothetical protein [Citrobacter]|uniref:hypothetical protein n=1 Tax=Citrobacter TaxID=544 RepID=UPI000E3DE009|nr:MULTISPECIES: hypothetical protein [Citrobacter]MBD0830002.1 hypothetical protein [Citrobacter sp. C1]RFU90212.1 hypothetical protein DZA29_18525 [Citrobacter gillenii]